jgi:cytoskeletal protein CcmA (bactofilin family)
MGLFGRDDRTDGNNPAPAENHPNHHKHTPASSSKTTLIAKTSHVEGQIKGAGEVHIDGTVKGKIDCSSAVIVAHGGKVEAQIKAETISIAGTLKGDAVASQKIELTPTAEVEGDITAPRILIREGATFEGQVFMTGNKKAKAPEPAKNEAKNPKTERK